VILHPTAPPPYEDKEGGVEVREGLHHLVATGTKVIIKGELMKEDEEGEKADSLQTEKNI
jgi:hypothetical protein